MAAPKAKDSAALAWEVAGKAEPKIAAALESALSDFQGKVSVERVRAFIIAGDLSGLSRYLQTVLGSVAGPVVTALDSAVTAAGEAAAGQINAALSQYGVTADTQLPIPENSPLAIVYQGVTPTFAYNPVNPMTIRAARTWQGNLIQQMSENSRLAAMDTITAGLVAGDNPRTTARRVKAGIGLTRHQNKAVLNFADDLTSIVENGMRSAQSWGIYTPRQIQQLKLRDRATFNRLNFTARERKEGRRWAKISRSAGTLEFDPKTGVKVSKPIGFVAPSRTQGGENAYRLTADGKPVDGMTQWRLRDKRFDPLIYENVAAGEALTDALESGDPVAIEKARARVRAAQAALGAEKDRMVDRYRARYLKHRSQTIARTESLRAANLGNYEAWRQTIEDADLFEPGEVKRVWITARDDRVRMTHRAAAGQTVNFDDPFTVDGDKVMVPPHGVNCRCTVGMQAKLGG